MTIKTRSLHPDLRDRHENIRINNINSAADTEHVIFVAPLDCTVKEVDVYSVQGFSANSSESLNFSVQLGSASGTVIGARAASVSGADSNNLTAFTRYRISATGNNSLTAGSMLVLNISSVCNAQLSAVTIQTRYEPTT